jgi:hypothetical protein
MDLIFTMSLLDTLPYAALVLLCVQIGAILFWFPSIVDEIRKNRRPHRREFGDGL